MDGSENRTITSEVTASTVEEAGIASLNNYGLILAQNPSFGSILARFSTIFTVDGGVLYFQQAEIYVAALKRVVSQKEPASFSIRCNQSFQDLWINVLPVGGARVALVVFAPSETGLESNLTKRELELLTLFAHGQRRDRVAHYLGISMATVDFHAGNLRRKMGARTTAEAVAIAVHQNILTASAQ
jgi:DNA-binding CsgD family transcriptional regulator